jgi:CMP-N-acetylneuraminic acid synthetase
VGNLVSEKKIAIILGRGGSKRIPRKNIVDFAGKPMIAWSIQAAINSRRFDRVCVSTDSDEIAQIARDYGAEVPFLRRSAADDVAPASEATIVTLEQAESFFSETYGVVAQLMGNCPLRNQQDIADAMDNFFKVLPDSQISCFRFGWMNPWWAAELADGGFPEFKFTQALTARSQDLPPLYCPSGAFWVANARALKMHRSFYGGRSIFHPMPWMSAMDIDDAEDLEMALACQLLLQSRRAETDRC